MKGANNKTNTKKVKVDKSQQANHKRLKPMNDKQKEYINAINVSEVVLCIGVLGSAKTYIPTCMAAEMLVKKRVKRIIIARPSEGRGKSLGFFKGTKEEKMEGWVSPITNTLKEQLGVTKYEYYLDNGQIEMLALEQIKGNSYDDAFLIVDEAEDLYPDVAKSLVTRIGVRSKLVITGDIAQQDMMNYSGLQLLLDVVKHNDLPVPLVNFDSWEYCVRGATAKMFGMGFEAWENKDD